MGNRGDVTNEQWERIEALLPKDKTKRGRPAQDHRKLLNGIVWVLRTGAPWRDMPERYGKWTTIYSRFQRWRKSGVWDKLFAELQTALDVESNVDWEIHFIDSTTVRAHQHAEQCEYTMSYPVAMQVNSQNPYNALLVFNLENPDEGARNLLYVSVITPEIQDRVRQGSYDHEVYNYDPAATEILLSMQVGESKPVHASLNVASGFTYQRQPDAMISGHTAQTYENDQPWEFPIGTKEIRYYLSLNNCVYLIGGYMDTTGSDQSGVITEDLFHRLVATIQVMP